MKLKELIRATSLIALLLALAISPTGILAAAPRQSSGPIASIRLETSGLRTLVAPTSVNVDQTVTYALDLSNLPAGGLTSVEFGCYFNSSMAAIDNINDAGLFGSNAVWTVNGPAGDTFIYAVAGVTQKATTGGTVFHIDLTGLAAGSFDFNCRVRASTGGALFEIPFTTTAITIIDPTGDGTLAGVVTARKTVTITMVSGSSTYTGTANTSTGAFSINAPAGTYTVTARAPGFLSATGSATLTSAATTTKTTIALVAGDIDDSGEVDDPDVLAIGNNYNRSTPTEADLNNDGVINVLDLQILAPNYGKIGPLPSAW